MKEVWKVCKKYFRIAIPIIVMLLMFYFVMKWPEIAGRGRAKLQ